MGRESALYGQRNYILGGDGMIMIRKIGTLFILCVFCLGAGPLKFPVRNVITETPGLIAYWPEVTPATKIIDHSGRHNNLTAVQTTMKTGFYGQIRYFDGADDYCTTTDEGINFSGNATVIAWVKPDADILGGGTSYHILNRANVSPGALTLYLHNTGDYIFQVRLTGSESTARPAYSNDEAISEWTFLAGTYDGDKVKLYVNRVLQVDIDNTNGTISSADYTALEVGRRPNNEDFYFKGSIRDAVIYDRALSIAEIEHIFRSTAWKYGVAY